MAQPGRKRIGIAAATLLVCGVAAFVWTFPALAALACPRCYGLEKAGSRLVVESLMPEPMRLQLQADIAAAEAVIVRFYGSSGEKPWVIACQTSACDQRLGGRGALAVTYSTPFLTAIRVGPRGLSLVILAHEFSHAELHQRLGLRFYLSSVLPAWFDEGVAVVVSDDPRYLNPGQRAAQRCHSALDDELPVRRSEWGSIAGRASHIYASAACRVLHWMEAHGGREGLLTAITEAGAGQRRLP